MIGETERPAIESRRRTLFNHDLMRLAQIRKRLTGFELPLGKLLQVGVILAFLFEVPRGVLSQKFLRVVADSSGGTTVTP